MRDLYEKLMAGTEIRSVLIEIKQVLRQAEKIREFRRLCDNDYTLIVNLLKDSDPKVRKNAALILGLLTEQSAAKPLLAAYEAEAQLFVRASYLTALKQLDYRPFLDVLKKRLEMLEKADILEEQKKHIYEEKQRLREMIQLMEGHKKHGFNGYKQESNLLLLTGKGFEDVLCQELSALPHVPKVKKIPGGVLVHGGKLAEILPIRVYKSLWFAPVVKMPYALDAEAAAQGLLTDRLIEYLDDRHIGEGCYYFRLDIRGDLPGEDRSSFIKETAQFLEEKSHGKLINSTSDYEVEIRLIMTKQANLMPYIRMMAIGDTRFIYRKNYVGVSMNPVTAAGVIAWARPWLKPQANVLDPFCGVATLLLERRLAGPVRDLYGVDTYGEAIEGGRKNAEHLRMMIQLIQRDFFDFEHEYLFDEVITDMPRVSQKMDKGTLKRLYNRFFEKIQQHLNDQAVLILYSDEPKLIQTLISKCPEFKLLKLDRLSVKENTVVCAIRYK